MTNEFGLPRFFQEADFQKSRGKPHFPQVTTLTLEVLSWSYLQTQKAKDVSELRGWARKVGRFLLNGPTSDLRMEGTKPVVTTAQAQAGG